MTDAPAPPPAHRPTPAAPRPAPTPPGRALRRFPPKWLIRPTFAELWAFLAVALPTLGALLAPMPAVDLAYQIRAGGEILDGLGIPTHDTWTFTIPFEPWLDLPWAAQVLLALTYRLGGWTGLAILRAGLVGLTFGLLYVVVRRRAPQLSARTAALLVLVAFAVAAPALALRPQLFAIVLFVLTLLILTERRVHPQRVWLIPVIAAAWANLHGSFPLVLVLCALAWLADAPLRRHGSTMLAVTALSAAATLVNPLGIDAWTYVVRLSTNATIGSRVSEWRPPDLASVPGILFWLSLALVVAWLGWRTARLREQRGTFALPVPLPALLTLAAFGGLAVLTGRGLAWWPLAAAFVIAGFLPYRRRPSDAPAPIDRRSPLNAIVAAALVVAGVALLPIWRPLGPAGVPAGTLSYAPQGTGAALRGSTDKVDQNDPRRIWAPQTWGSWLELVATGRKLAVDARIEIFPQRIWEEYDTVASGTGAWSAILDRYDVHFVVTQAGADTRLEAALAASPKAGLLYRDADGAVWGWDSSQP